jgi:signal transduction histidine kinase
VEELRARAHNLVEMKRGAEAALRLNAELRENVTQLRQVAALLESSNQELESFSYSVSHDLRAPLRAIDGFSKALLEEPDPARREHYVARIRAGAQRMSALIDALLDLARVARAPLHRQAVDLTEIARGVAAELQQRQPERAVALEIAEGLRAQGDPQLVTIVLENLLGNAWKFTGKQPHPSVKVGSQADGAGVAFFVADNGAGFDMEQAHHLFAPFQRLHATADFEGTGIGLATVHRIVARHGGRIWAEARTGQGATFHFTLEGT